jgi:uncharacterized membrane protein
VHFLGNQNQLKAMNSRAFLTAGTLLGIGLGGFLDGIIFHQVLQLHSMLSAELPQDNLVNVKSSMVWDGLFHLFTWLTTVAGLAVLWKAIQSKEGAWSARTFWGTLLLGWGIFNTVEGVIDHFLLDIHHLVERLGRSVYDYLYLLSGLLMILAGLYLVGSGRRGLVAPKPR